MTSHISRTIFSTSFLVLLCLFCSSLLWAESATEKLFDDANRAYSQKDFELAIETYTDLLNKQGYSPAVLYNLANSYAQTGEIGKAILYYQRALILSPFDGDIAGNLEKVWKENGLFQPEPSGIEMFFTPGNTNLWATVLLCSTAFLSFFFLSSLKLNYGKATSLTVYCTGTVFVLIGLLGTTIGYQKINPSIVLAKDAKMLISPFESANSIGAIMPGRKVYPVKKHGNFLLVQDETGRKGWLTKNQIEAVIK